MKISNAAGVTCLLLCMTNSWARDVPRWRYATIPAINVTITTNAAVDKNSSAAHEALENCRNFVLTPALVKQYFRAAKPVSDRDGMESYQVSRCMAKGRIKFANGDKGDWHINSSRLGYIDIGNGQHSYVFCRDTDCKATVYDYWIGVNSDAEGAEEEERQESIEASKKVKPAAKRKTSPKS